MLLFIKGFIVGIGKIIPGVSGAMLAISFNIYEKLINSITHFFYNWKKNLKFLLIFSSGSLIAIVLFSGIVLYLMTNYKFLTMTFFIGLIIGGTYNFSKSINYNIKTTIYIISIIFLFFFLNNRQFNNDYILNNNYIDNIIFFIGGILEIVTSIVPGVSGTAFLMMMGIYNHVLALFSNVFNYQYVLDNINLYLSYGGGMFLSFIVFSYLVAYFIKKHRHLFNITILGLSISSILYLIIMTSKLTFNLWQLLFGIILLIIGTLTSHALDK